MRRASSGLRFFFCALVLVSLGSCEFDPAAALDGQEFLLQSSEGFRPVDGTTVQLAFQDDQLTLSAGCNSMFGSFEVRESRLIVDELGTTDIGCDAALQAQDEWLANFLSAQPLLTQANDRLTLKGGVAQLVFVGRAVAEPDRQLVGTVWTVDTFLEGDAAIDIFLDPGPSVVFADDLSVRIDTTCNAATGSYTLVDDRLTVAGVTFSSNVCTGAAKSADAHLRKLFRAGKLAAQIEGDRLTLGTATVGISATAGDFTAPNNR